jgi:hypothetical protein
VAERGWTVSGIDVDTGEDLIVKVFDDGRPSSLQFLVQLKSATDATIQADALAVKQRIAVSDLTDWEGMHPPVALVVWNVSTHRGFWQTASNLLVELDRTQEGWRTQQTVTLTIPVSNPCDPSGLDELRKAIAEQLVPVHAPDRVVELRLEFDFDRRPHGGEAKEKWHQFLRVGGETKVEKQYVKKLGYPKWYHRLFGGAPTIPEGIVVKSPDEGKRISLRVEVRTDSGVVALPRTELVMRRQGSEEALFFSALESDPIEFSLVARTDSTEITFRRRSFGATFAELRQVLAFLLAL